MTDDTHSCGYHCTRPGCVEAQRAELLKKVERLEAAIALYPALPGGAEALRRLKRDAEGDAL